MENRLRLQGPVTTNILRDQRLTPPSYLDEADDDDDDDDGDCDNDNDNFVSKSLENCRISSKDSKDSRGSSPAFEDTLTKTDIATTSGVITPPPETGAAHFHSLGDAGNFKTSDINNAANFEHYRADDETSSVADSFCDYQSADTQEFSNGIRGLTEADDDGDDDASFFTSATYQTKSDGLSSLPNVVAEDTRASDSQRAKNLQDLLSWEFDELREKDSADQDQRTLPAILTPTVLK